MEKKEQENFQFNKPSLTFSKGKWGVIYVYQVNAAG